MPVEELLQRVLNEYQSIFGKNFYLSYESQRRVLDFLERIKELYKFTDEEIPAAYRYLFEWLKQKGYQVKVGHLCSVKVIELLQKARSGIGTFPKEYHALYRKAVKVPRSPYDLKVRTYCRFADQLRNASKVIYVPSTGLYLEEAIHVVGKIVEETHLWHKNLEDLREVYFWYRDEVGKHYRYRDRSKIWRRKPPWKALILKEYFATPFGAFRYAEVEYLLSVWELVSANVDKNAVNFVEKKLMPSFYDFRQRYEEYLWMLPQARKRVTLAIDRLARPHRS